MKNTVSGDPMTFSQHLGKTLASRTPSYVFNHTGKATRLTSDKAFSMVLAAHYDDDNSACQAALTHGVRMFGPKSSFYNAETTPRYNSVADVINWVTTQTCHAANSQKEPSSVTGAAVTTMAETMITNAVHDTHKIVGKCDCALKCLLCKKVSHNARSRACLKRGDFQPPRLPDTDKHVSQN
jgi:hypothetical protein